MLNEATHSCILRISVVGDEVLLEDDQILLPKWLGKLSLKGKRLGSCFWLCLSVNVLSVLPAKYRLQSIAH